MGTKTSPGKFDCFHKAADDEPLFTLLARDVHAAGLVRDWCLLSIDTQPPEKIEEAQALADAMEKWREQHT
jgi:hypothetical protein